MPKSDITEETELLKGNSVSLILNCRGKQKYINCQNKIVCWW